MRKITLMTALVVSFVGPSYASEGDDHSGHGHSKKEEHSQGDGHQHKKNKNKKHEKHKGHTENDEKDHGESGHEGHDDHEERGHSDHGEEDGHGDHGDAGKAVGEGKAIVAVDELKGFKLSPEAIKALELKLTTVSGDEFTIKKSTLVASKNLRGVYRFRGGFFKLLEVKIISEAKKTYKVKVKGVEFGDQIVTDGLGLLRISDVYSTDKSNYGHSH